MTAILSREIKPGQVLRVLMDTGKTLDIKIIGARHYPAQIDKAGSVRFMFYDPTGEPGFNSRQSWIRDDVQMNLVGEW